MTREEMIKRRWKAYETILYQDAGMKYPAECLLSEVDFDGEVLTLTPMNDFYQQNEFQANLKYCSLPKMKPAAIDGKKISDKNDNFIKAKKIGSGDYFEDDENYDPAS